MTTAALVFTGLVAFGVGVAAVSAVILRALDGLLWDGSLTNDEDIRP